MKTTIELPDTLLRRAKVVAAQRGATLRELVIEGLQHVTARGVSPSKVPGKLTAEERAVAVLGPHGLPVLKRRAGARPRKVTCASVERLREEMGI